MDTQQQNLKTILLTKPAGRGRPGRNATGHTWTQVAERLRRLKGDRDQRQAVGWGSTCRGRQTSTFPGRRALGSWCALDTAEARTQRIETE